MGLHTTAFAAQDALVAALQDSEALAGWEIDYGIPTVRPTELNIWVSEDVSDWQQAYATSGLDGRDEVFRLAVYIFAQRTGATAKEVRDEIATAGGVVEDVVGSSPFLGGVVMLAEVAGGQYDAAFAGDDGRAREGLLKLIIACQAFVTTA